MRRFLLFLFLFHCCFFSGFSKSKQAYEKVKQVLLRKDYNKVVSLCTSILKKEPHELRAKLYLADAYHYLGDVENEIAWLQSTVEQDATFFPKASYLLAKNYFSIQDYSKALESITLYQTLVSELSFEEELLLRSTTFVHQNTTVKREVLFTDELDSINSKFNEYSPAYTLRKGELFFTKELEEEGYAQEDIYLIKQMQEGIAAVHPLDGEINTLENEGAQCLSGDGNFLIFTACNKLDGMGSCDLYISRRNGDAGWSEALNLGPNVNSNRWDSQPSLSTDGNYLYFASGRGDKGRKSDLYVSKRIDFSSHGFPMFGKAKPVSNHINTQLDEFSPFIHPNGQDLFFVSDGHPGYGGTDLFVSEKQLDQTWGEPQNLGIAFNDHLDSYGMIVAVDGTHGVMAKKTIQGDFDLFPYECNPSFIENKVEVVNGVVFDKDNAKGLRGNITFVDRLSNDTLAHSISSQVDGTFVVSLPQGTSYRVLAEAEGYLFYSDTIDSHFVFEHSSLEMGLEKIRAGSSVELKNVFFAVDSHTLNEDSFSELKAISGFMTKNPSLQVEIGGHTDSSGDASYNLILSEKRAKEVVIFLKECGIADWRITYKGYGSTKPVKENASVLGRQANRRTELKIIRVK